MTLDETGLPTLPYTFKPVNDGDWHYIIITWEKLTGHIDLVVDFVRHGQLDGFAAGEVFSGGGYDTTHIQCILQVNVTVY